MRKTRTSENSPECWQDGGGKIKLQQRIGPKRPLSTRNETGRKSGLVQEYGDISECEKWKKLQGTGIIETDQVFSYATDRSAGKS